MRAFRKAAERQIAKTRAACTTLTDPGDRQTAMRAFAGLELKTNIARQTRRKWMR